MVTINAVVVLSVIALIALSCSDPVYPNYRDHENDEDADRALEVNEAGDDNESETQRKDSDEDILDQQINDGINLKASIDSEDINNDRDYIVADESNPKATHDQSIHRFINKILWGASSSRENKNYRPLSRRRHWWVLGKK
ncbi:uncharacterized protein TRIADDRAFT_64229 [Trichoplax adhaerens]|uniref:Expressed protein n=1 Tax=Trichoplax adhaerens TaxID=10228 RepID=B3S6T3_TRIAD|nr:expressed protein [Trichoplax adhaerens]EDV21813.1 expressed protein [Trichoplax adhaerens]|eukprot:XP_002115961.1 expressed protein [Trichoplax adhaerens]